MSACHRQPIYGYDHDRWLRLIGAPLVSLAIPPLFFNNTYSHWEGYWGKVWISFVFTVVIWETNRLGFRYLARKFPNPEDTTRRIGLMILLGIVVTLAACAPVNLLLAYLLPHDHTPPPTIAQKYGASFLLLLTTGAIYESRRFFQLWQKTALEKEQLERAHLASQLDGLRSQVNPHFLFNSLNTLIYLIPEDPSKAVRFVQQLSKVYRYVLESRDDKIIPLASELDFLKSYIFLLKERFGDNLRIEMDGLESRAQTTAIVPLTLQILFENAIKHNVISADKPLTINVFAENGSLLVRNNLQLKNQVMDSTGVGLDNIRQRYQMLADRELGVTTGEGFFEVKLPLLKIEATS